MNLKHTFEDSKAKTCAFVLRSFVSGVSADKQETPSPTVVWRWSCPPGTLERTREGCTLTRENNIINIAFIIVINYCGTRISRVTITVPTRGYGHRDDLLKIATNSTINIVLYLTITRKYWSSTVHNFNLLKKHLLKIF